MNNIWFTSDLHFGHTNIIRFCGRPYSDVKEMDQDLINNWNSVVHPDDTVYMLGDIFFCKFNDALKIMDQLNGHKNLVYGNHDKVIRNNEVLQKKFSLILDDLDQIEIDGYKLVLCHYPMWSWNGASRGAIQLHGHIHSNKPVQPHKRQYDVGVDNNNYCPVNWNYIKSQMLTIELTPF
jgi:calcineurin-like phosphoesterase family protein